MPNLRVARKLETSGAYLPPSFDFNPPPAPWAQESDAEVDGARMTPAVDSVPFPLIRPAAESTLERRRAPRLRRILARVLFVLLFGSVLALLAYEISIARHLLAW